jgi:TRAP-type C4-dicarboxylate transport system permease small subunit
MGGRRAFAESMEIERAAWFSGFRRGVITASLWFERAGLLAIVAMVLVALIDVVGSKAFKWPLPGSTEITGVVQVVAISAGLAFSKIDGRHIRVGLFTDSLTGRGQAALEIFISLLGLGFFAIAGWMTFEYGITQHSMGTGTFLLGIIYYPFSFWIALCCVPLCLALVIDLIIAVGRVLK